VPPAVAGTGLDQALDLGRGQMLARPSLNVRAPARRFRASNCPIIVPGTTSAKCDLATDLRAFPSHRGTRFYKWVFVVRPVRRMKKPGLSSTAPASSSRARSHLFIGMPPPAL
jgi:hypothetical protein